MSLSRFSYLKDCSFYLELSLLQTTYLVESQLPGQEGNQKTCGDTHMGRNQSLLQQPVRNWGQQTREWAWEQVSLQCSTTHTPSLWKAEFAFKWQRNREQTGVVVQMLSHVQLFATPWTAAHQAILSFTVSQFAQIHVHSVIDTIWPSHSLMCPSRLAFNLSKHQGLL